MIGVTFTLHASPTKCQSNFELWQCVASKALWCDQPTRPHKTQLEYAFPFYAQHINDGCDDTKFPLRCANYFSPSSVDKCFISTVVRQACARAIPRPQPQSINWKSHSPTIHRTHHHFTGNWNVPLILWHRWRRQWRQRLPRNRKFPFCARTEIERIIN